MLRSTLGLDRNINSSPEEYLIIPLTGKPPYKKKLSSDTQLDDCVAVNFKLAKKWKSQPIKSHVPFEQLIAEHDSTKKKIVLNDMGELGVGAFAGDDIEAGETLIYPGVINTEPNIGGDVDQQQYKIAIYKDSLLGTNIILDAKNCNGVSRYFQHLPAENNCIRNGETVSATENFRLFQKFTRIIFKNTSYIIPLVILSALKEIKKDGLVGYDYGMDYWQRRKPFTYLNSIGKPVTSYWIECVKASVGMNAGYCFRVPLNIAAFAQTISDLYFQVSKGEYYLFSKESADHFKEICTTLPNVKGNFIISLPVIIDINSEKVFSKKNNLIIEIDPQKEFVLPENDVVSQFGIQHQIIHGEVPVLVIPIEKITSASCLDIIKLKSFLQKSGVLFKEEFEIRTNPKLLSEIKAKQQASSTQHHGMFSSSDKLSLPRELVDRIIEIKSERLMTPT